MLPNQINESRMISFQFSIFDAGKRSATGTRELRAARSLSFILAASFLRKPPSRPRVLLHSRVSASDPHDAPRPASTSTRPRPAKHGVAVQREVAPGGLGNPHSDCSRAPLAKDMNGVQVNGRAGLIQFQPPTCERSHTYEDQRRNHCRGTHRASLAGLYDARGDQAVERRI